MRLMPRLDRIGLLVLTVFSFLGTSPSHGPFVPAGPSAGDGAGAGAGAGTGTGAGTGAGQEPGATYPRPPTVPAHPSVDGRTAPEPARTHRVLARDGVLAAAGDQVAAASAAAAPPRTGLPRARQRMPGCRRTRRLAAHGAARLGHYRATSAIRVISGGTGDLGRFA
ncbi:hypothetical protein GCM10010495_70340 [Kitasatospora herbaricolor]|nr:hypothetical protein GCM10010495_70340 [Kitasatospora herbaricolor]